MRRDRERSALHQTMRTHLETFLDEARASDVDGRGVPSFVETELRRFLECGVLAHGFARFHCDACGADRLVAFSCKGRGFCPSCGGRRMTARAGHLVDEVLPWVAMRQWVLSLPFEIRFRLAFDHELTRAVLAIFTPGSTSRADETMESVRTQLYNILEGVGYPADEQYGRGSELLELVSCR